MLSDRYAIAVHDLEATQAERNVVQGQLDDCSEAYELVQAEAERLRAEVERLNGVLYRFVNACECGSWKP